MSPLAQAILALADGVRTSREIAVQLGCNDKHVQNVIRRANAPRLPRGARSGALNPAWIDGRSIDLDGYALVPAPPEHLTARRSGRILEHRLVMERQLGRLLLESETVDHIDGLHLHNDPLNLRVFDTNAAHLTATISGLVPRWSEAGLARMRTAPALRGGMTQVDTYRLRKERGDVRLQQILLAALRFGPASPFLLGTIRLLEKAGIDPSQRPNLERALADLERRFAADLAPSGQALTP